MQAWTDYPFIELGDVEGKLAPMRPCTPLAWDRDKYVTIKVEGIITTIKSSYLYSKPRPPSFPFKELIALPYTVEKSDD